MRRGCWKVLAALIACAFATATTARADPALPDDTLTPLQQREAERAVDRALRFIASQQAEDGSFPSVNRCQPGVTALCVLAFLSRGHLPQQGPYGRNIEQGIAFIIEHQRDDGLINGGEPEGSYISRGYGHCALYNHAIAGLALSEAYGMGGGGRDRSDRMRGAIERARDYSLGRQKVQKHSAKDEGGWRYIISPEGVDSDMSITSWQLLFLRSARNAGFAVPAEPIDAAAAYVERCFDADAGTFLYALEPERSVSRAMAGAGILSLSLSGKHETPRAHAAGDWILRHPFARFGASVTLRDRFFYGVFYATQGMFQLGGRYWKEFYPPLVAVMLAHQEADGSWMTEPRDAEVGRAYTTAMTVLALNTPHQLLPIFQR